MEVWFVSSLGISQHLQPASVSAVSLSSCLEHLEGSGSSHHGPFPNLPEPIDPSWSWGDGEMQETHDLGDTCTKSLASGHLGHKEERLCLHRWEGLVQTFTQFSKDTILTYLHTHTLHKPCLRIDSELGVDPGFRLHQIKIAYLYLMREEKDIHPTNRSYCHKDSNICEL